MPDKSTAHALNQRQTKVYLGSIIYWDGEYRSANNEDCLSLALNIEDW